MKPVKALVELPAMAKPAKKKLMIEIPALLLEGDQAPGAHPGGPGSRYALGLAAAADSGSAQELALPESYGTRKVWLVPRDPQWLYVHWDLDNTQQREYNQLSRDGHMILRVYLADAPVEPVTEIHVHPESRSWFAHVGKGGGQYFAVLGFRDRTGEWNEINRSGTVGTPPDSLSEEVEASFVTLLTPDRPLVAEEPRVEAAEPVEAANPPVEQGAAAAPEPPPVQTLAEIIEAVRDYITGDPELIRAIEQVCDAGHPHLPRRIELPPPSEFVHWTPEQQQALAEVISMDAVRQVWAGGPPTSLAVMEAKEEERRKELASIAALPAAGPGEAIAPGAISSPHGGVPAGRAFWFVVNAELVVYGATEPTARVVIGDRPIKLRKDGTFSYRFALPDGWYGLPVSATSADQVETRYVTLRFMRESEYGGEVGAHAQDPGLKPPGPQNTE